MKKKSFTKLPFLVLSILIIATSEAIAQSPQTFSKKTYDPWAWGKNTNSVQAVEISSPKGTLYCSGQVAIDSNGVASSANMRTQLIQTIKNLEQLIKESGYECRGIIRLNIYTTSTKDFFMTCSDIYAGFINKYGIKQATSLIEVNGLFASINVELEATVVK